MKKFLLLVLMFANYSAFATEPDISANTTSASCDSEVLNSNDGPANIEINWEPNEINLRWYNGNTLVESNTCSYDGGLTIPDINTTRTGYTFRGFRVRPTYDFTQLNNTINGSSRYAIIKAQNLNNDLCYYDSQIVACKKYTDFVKLQRYEWKVVYSYGTVYGMSKCNTSDAFQGTTSANIAETEGPYCWCKATGFQPSGEDTVYGPIANLKWVHYAGAGTTEYCLYRCASYCAYMASTSKIGPTTTNSAYRARLFGQQN